ncbi:MAG: hypothetical protein JWN08_1129 [Frankiales bacterium]|nr:hypothetical protein [Frankiales bacterium]
MDDTETVAPETQAAVDAAIVRVDALLAADSELVHGDVVETVAADLPLDAAVLLCVQTMDFVPDTVRRRVFEEENAETIAANAIVVAERDALAAKAKQRSAKAAATRAATLAREAEVEKAALKSATCPDCFQLRAASGVCGCD